MSKETIEIPLVKATYEELQEVICELQVERFVKNKEIERLNNIIDELILECYNCDITFGEFKNIWKKAYNKEYNSKDLDKLKELKEGK